MSATNLPCAAELRFMQLMPRKMQELTEAALKLSESMDRLSAAVEKQNAQALTVHAGNAPGRVDAVGLTCRRAVPDSDHTPDPPYEMLEEMLNG